MKTEVEILTKARALIAEPAQWTTGIFARDAKGERVLPLSSSAVCFCALGAFFKATGKYLDKETTSGRLLISSATHLYGKSLPFVNDRLGHSAVLAVYDHAIDRAKNGTALKAEKPKGSL